MFTAAGNPRECKQVRCCSAGSCILLRPVHACTLVVLCCSPFSTDAANATTQAAAYCSCFDARPFPKLPLHRFTHPWSLIITLTSSRSHHLGGILEHILTPLTASRPRPFTHRSFILSLVIWLIPLVHPLTAWSRRTVSLSIISRSSLILSLISMPLILSLISKFGCRNGAPNESNRRVGR